MSSRQIPVEGAWPEQFPLLSFISKELEAKFPYFSRIVERQQARFGPFWLESFEDELTRRFHQDPDLLRRAVEAYGHFCLDGMRLQSELEETGHYPRKTHAEASREVYQDERYMLDRYLPGIHLTHFLWPHHFLQYLFFLNRFIPLYRKAEAISFLDVGVGTGFYSKEVLRNLPNAQGLGVDLSPYSLRAASELVNSWGFQARYSSRLADITSGLKEPPSDLIISVEVLEHLDDPPRFIKALVNHLAPGGHGFITAALTAGEVDHIYLYHEASEVARQLEAAGVKVLDHAEHPAYPASRAGQVVPRSAAFIIRKPPY